MSEKPKFPRKAAMDVAVELAAAIGGDCERIVVAGSLRRGKEQVGDVELLFIPKMEERPDGLFDYAQIDLADERLTELLKRGVISKRENIAGGTTWGPRNKLAVHIASGIPVDFFSTSVQHWFVSLVIRTGSKETNLRLTTGANKLNRTLNAYGGGVTDRATGLETPATSERAVFELCGVPYLEPQIR